MLTESSDLQTSANWYLIACEGDLVLKLAHDLAVGEDSTGELVLSPVERDALLKLSLEDGRLTLHVMALDMTFSVAGGPSVQHVGLEHDGTVKIRLPNNTLSLSTKPRGGGRETDFLDIALMRTRQPAITRSRVPVDDIDAPIEPVGEPIGEPAVTPTEAARVDQQPSASDTPHAEVDDPAEQPTVEPPIQLNRRPGRRWIWLLGLLLLGLAAALLPNTLFN